MPGLGIHVNAFVPKTIIDHAHKLTTETKKKSSRVIEDMDVSAVFGIEFDEPAAPKPKVPKRAGKEKSEPSRAAEKLARRPVKRKTETASPKKTKKPAKKKNDA